MDTSNNVSVVVPMKNEEGTIMKCLMSLIQQSLRPIEIIVVDGGSQDQSNTIVQHLQTTSSVPIHLLVHHGGIGAQRMYGTAHAQGNYIAYIDSDCVAPTTWLEQLSHTLHLASPSTAGVGGPHCISQNPSANEYLIHLVKSSPIGGMDTLQTRQEERIYPVHHIPGVNGIFHKNILLTDVTTPLGLPTVAEDGDLSIQLQRQGYTLLWNSNAYVVHHDQPTLLSWLRTMFRYGRGRAFLVKKYPSYHLQRSKYILPAFAAIIWICILLVHPAIAVVLVLTYTLCIFFYVLFLLVYTKFPVYHFFLLGLYFAITHWVYALGQIYGFIVPLQSSMKLSHKK